VANTYRNNQSTVTLLAHCRQLRRERTDAELKLWRLLRGRQVAAAKFRRQHQFGPYILDFFCAEQRLVIEADGGQHFEPEHAARDARRTKYLEARGLRVLRFTDTEILLESEAVLEAIVRALG
jgi:very-short-patch-repair endonuclease